MKALIATVLLLVLGVSAQAQIQMVTNGNLESWGTLTANNTGTISSWGYSGTYATQIAGLVSGSTYAAMISYGTSINPGLSGASSPKQFELSFVFAATDPGSTSNRSFNLSINQTSGATPSMNFRTVQGSSGAGYITLQAFNGSAWKDVATNLLATSDLTVGSGSALMNAYTFDLTVDYSASTWSLTYGLVGSSTTIVSGLNYFQSNNGNGLGSVAFIDTYASTNTAYAIDNVSVLTTVPEPHSIALMLLGLMTLLRIHRRKTA